MSVNHLVVTRGDRGEFQAFGQEELDHLKRDNRADCLAMAAQARVKLGAEAYRAWFDNLTVCERYDIGMLGAKLRELLESKP